MQTISKPKACEEKAGDRDVLGNESFEKLSHIPRNLEVQISAQCWAHAQKRPEKALYSHQWLTLHKQKEKTEAEL